MNYLLLRMYLLWWSHFRLQTKEACQYILPSTDCFSSRFFVWYGYLFFSETGTIFWDKQIILSLIFMLSIYRLVCIISSPIAIIHLAIFIILTIFSPLVSYSTSTHHYFKVILPSHQCALCHRWTKLIDRIHWYCSGTILQSARTILYP